MDPMDGNGFGQGDVAHVDSLYAQRLTDRRLHPALEGRIRSDIAVIGGGLAGLTAALQLKQQGHSVVLLEARRVGWGASGRNGGFVAPGFAESLFAVENRVGLEAARQLYALSQQGAAYVRHQITAAGRPDIVAGSGWMHVIRHRKTDSLRRQRDRMLRDYGVDLQVLSEQDVKSRLRTERYHGALVDPNPFHIDPLAYSELLAQQCIGSGVGLYEKSPVTAVDRQNSRFMLETDHGSVQADQVVVATSAYGGPVAAVENCILPVATYVIASEPADGALQQAINWTGCIADTRRAGDYYRVIDGAEGRRLLWGGRITTRRTEPKNLAAKLMRDIIQVYPSLAGLKVAFSWSGLMGYARHKMPVVCQHRPGLYVLTGFGGHGLNMTAAGALAVAEAIGGQPDRLELFKPYGLVWGGGPVGRIVTQLEYFRLRFTDLVDEM